MDFNKFFDCIDDEIPKDNELPKENTKIYFKKPSSFPASKKQIIG